ncbi:Pr6Pr family membrane protein [Demequina globuliformis]|uniref:Pr6Pr family membrane protein n=1 Tax=Demequina globuliformis TaxID=676202 RepID=UPI00078680F3|nr:Pr6Pr family membrane protein [Demequina globuliformis]
MSNVAYIRLVRIAGAAAIIAALGVQAWADLTFGSFSWDQMPGYFTPLAALTAVAALLIAAMAPRPDRWWIDALRVNAATYTTVAGVVYWALLADHAIPKVPWANAMLHGGAGVILVLDWLVVGRRRRLPLRTWPTVLAVPSGWCAYLLIRATRDGWVPYPFLDPARGVPAITATVTVILAAGLACAALLHTCTFLRRERPHATAGQRPLTGELAWERPTP